MNPQFVSNVLPNPNLHLQTNANAINKGNPSFVPFATELDYDGQFRIFGNRVDCGADEFYDQEAHIVLSGNHYSIFFNPYQNLVIVKGQVNNYDIRIFKGSTLYQDLSGSGSPIEIDLAQPGGLGYWISVDHIVLTPLSLYKQIK